MSTTCRNIVFTASRTRSLQNDFTKAVSRSAVQAYSTSQSRRPQSVSTNSLFQCSPKPSRTQQRTFHASYIALSSQPPKFTYGIAASFTAKDRRYNPDTNVFDFNPYNPIHARRRDKRTRPGSGQDAFFVSKIGSSPDIALGIADGVGGWADSGVDPADFAHGFCDYMAYAAYTTAEGAAIGARELMQKGYEDICGDPTVEAGGSTACVGIVRGDGGLEVANLGDSGFIQLRSNRIHNYSEPQTHGFNAPYQLSMISKELQEREELYGGQRLQDLPKDANLTKHRLRHGDVLVFASDGVWDNLAAQDILKGVSHDMLGSGAWEYTDDDGVAVGERLKDYIKGGDATAAWGDALPTLQSVLAVGITSAAKSASVDKYEDGPFAREVQKYYPHENWRGGKVDDICVVVAIVCEEGR